MYMNRFFTSIVFVALAVITALTAQEAIATAEMTSKAKEAERTQLSRSADAARWTAMAAYYELVSSNP